METEKKPAWVVRSLLAMKSPDTQLADLLNDITSEGWCQP